MTCWNLLLSISEFIPQNLATLGHFYSKKFMTHTECFWSPHGRNWLLKKTIDELNLCSFIQWSLSNCQLKTHICMNKSCSISQMNPLTQKTWDLYKNYHLITSSLINCILQVLKVWQSPCFDEPEVASARHQNSTSLVGMGWQIQKKDVYQSRNYTFPYIGTLSII